jgi:hypothetical protein
MSSRLDGGGGEAALGLVARPAVYASHFQLRQNVLP